MLGDQPWGLPDTFDTFNTGARLDYTFPRIVGGLCGSQLQPLAHPGQRDLRVRLLLRGRVQHRLGSVSDWFFAPDGTYDIYDYRNPGELRIDAEAEAMVTGHIKTGAITQDLTAGGELFLRSVQQPGFYTRCRSVFARWHRAGWRGLTPTSVPRTSTSQSHYRRRSQFARARSNPPARAACGKTAISRRR